MKHKATFLAGLARPVTTCFWITALVCSAPTSHPWAMFFWGVLAGLMAISVAVDALWQYLDSREAHYERRDRP